jgi:CMP-N-acetylneuraminic acid synthetase
VSSGLLVLVPARQGSKRLPDKNFKEFLGRPLYLRALDQALALDDVSSVIFSSDIDAEKLELPEAVIHDQRPAELSGDEASSQALARYLYDKYGKGESGILWLQPCTPLRRLRHIQEARAKWAGRGLLVSCAPAAGKHLRFLDNDGLLQNKGPGLQVSLNGAIFFVESGQLIKDDWVTGAQGFLMQSDESVDIDLQEDWDRALKLMEDK